MISVVVPTQGRSSLLNLLDSVNEAREQFVLNGASVDSVEVIVCVDTSRATVSDVQETLSRLSWKPKVVESVGSGVNSARNSGAQLCCGDIILFLDDDVELPSRSSLIDLELIFKNDDLIATGGDYISGPRASWAERGYNALCSAWRTSAGRETRELLLGGCLAVRRSAWKVVGGFDIAINYGGSETSFVLKLHKLGLVLFFQKLNVIHHPGSRSLVHWWRVASLQGLRRSETAWSLPNRRERFGRTFRCILDQSRTTVFCLAIFAIPFLTASLLSRISSTRTARSARPIEEPRKKLGSSS